MYKLSEQLFVYNEPLDPIVNIFLFFVFTVVILGLFLLLRIVAGLLDSMLIKFRNKNGGKKNGCELS